MRVRLGSDWSHLSNRGYILSDSVKGGHLRPWFLLVQQRRQPVPVWPQ